MKAVTKTALTACILTACLWACVVWQQSELAAFIGLALIPTLSALETETKRAKRK